MSGIDIKCVFPSLVGKYARAKNELMLFTAAQIQTNRGMLFDANGARNGGVLWPQPMLRVGQPLGARGTLRKSLGANGKAGPGGVVRFTGTKVAVGSSLIYAAMMNFGTEGLPGGVLRAKDGKSLRIPIPAGKRATETAQEIRKSINVTTKIERKQRAGKELTDDERELLRHRTGRVEVNKITGKNEHVIYRKWVKIPARRFDQLTEKDVHEIGTALANKLAEVLNR